MIWFRVVEIMSKLTTFLNSNLPRFPSTVWALYLDLGYHKLEWDNIVGVYTDMMTDSRRYIVELTGIPSILYFW